MLNLILKDILIQKKMFLFGLLYIVFFIFVFQDLGSGAFVAGSTAITYIFVITACTYEDKNKSDILLNSLPIKRKKIVGAKYISLFVYVGIGATVYLGAVLIVKVLGISVKINPITLEGLIGALVSVILMNSIYFPIFFKFGATVAKVVYFLLFFVFFFGGSKIFVFLAKSHNNAWIESMKFLENQSDMQIAVYIIGVAITLLLSSYLLSLKFYKNREF